MTQMRIPTEIRFIAKEGGSTKHIHSGHPFEVTLCGIDLWPVLKKQNNDDLPLFSMCKNCKRVWNNIESRIEMMSERIPNGS